MVYVVQSSPAVKTTVIYGGDVEAELIIHCSLSVADVIQYTRYRIQSLEHSLWKSQLRLLLEPSGNCQNLFNTLNIFIRKKRLFFFFWLFVFYMFQCSCFSPPLGPALQPPYSHPISSLILLKHTHTYTHKRVNEANLGILYGTSGHFTGTQLTGKRPIHNLNVWQ